MNFTTQTMNTITDNMNTTTQTINRIRELTYDVVIMGGGFAGNAQARHLLLNIPNIKIAIIDPRSPERTVKDLTVGESTVEIAADFLMKELGLYEYLIENHAPKHGLSFHWSKNPNQTNTIDDYYHVWTNTIPPTEAFQLNRAKLEQDLLQMNKDMGATFYRGRVLDFDLTSKDELHAIKVKLEDDKIELKAKHLIDASGRRFLIGKKTDNLIFDVEKLYGINTGSSWVHVKGIDRTLMDDGYNPDTSLASRYYTTNHWFGHGHWIWMLPINKGGNELSIGVVYHQNVIPTKDINTSDKFKAFLKANHTLLYNIVESGELVDFRNLPRLAHKSKKVISEDNWYVLGDAAQMLDPFYSPGLTLAALAVESVTESIRAKLSQEPDAEKKQNFYNRFLVNNVEAYNRIYQKHENHLGHASAMSWRTYTEDMLWFGILVPMYIGKWFLDFDFISQYQRITNFIFFGKNSVMTDFYGLLDKVVERKLNVGIMDFTRNDQLLFGYGPVQFFDDYLKNTKFEPLHCNVFKGIKGTFFFLILMFLKLRFKAFGILGAISPRSIFRTVQLLALYLYVAIGEQIYLLKMRNVPDNTVIDNMRKDFQNYQYQPKLKSWSEGVKV
ncbi:MAG: tryptophan 7-halogenase [Mastigocoleus sp. MO_167.B18]|uniref:NAD(P)/FAD-dependent oxidoreductase n=1 Tax=Mastigocoleus sp. MO_188.B34 TaxID=3036635 RepID=UPI0026114E29|nr:tryptophan 7-halogenase [Mastigocoleus sp. MO_188.B34]MDJ0697859.1 tryptophan 7-halogenase [Mastigocoleus sp. MO_188.B34]MDJ0772697.1 tryptophan 7-halogenase [Mastigocoleus sp. MO_167.B18]